jgi:hypothetical protein
METILYVMIVGTVLATMAGFLMNIVGARAKAIAISDVTDAARVIQTRLTDTARHASALNVGASTFNSDPGVLSFDMVLAGVDPTVFSLTSDNGQFQVQQAGGAQNVLTSSRVAITNLTFTNLTSDDDLGIIQVTYTVEMTTDSSSPLLEYAQTFQTTLRVPLDD